MDLKHPIKKYLHNNTNLVSTLGWLSQRAGELLTQLHCKHFSQDLKVQLTQTNSQ